MRAKLRELVEVDITYDPNRIWVWQAVVFRGGRSFVVKAPAHNDTHKGLLKAIIKAIEADKEARRTGPLKFTIG